MSTEERWVELNITGHRVTLPAKVGIKLFEVLTSGAGAYNKEYDWQTEQHWIEPTPTDSITLNLITPEKFAIMKLLGVNKIAEKAAALEAKRLERERKA